MSDLVPFATAVAGVRARYQLLIDEAERWCHEHDEPVDPDLFALVCAGVRPFDDECETGEATLWSRIGVRVLLRCGIPNFCSRTRCIWPIDVVRATWLWLDFLHHTRRLDPRSDPLWELRKPLICYGGLDFDGHPRPADDPSPIPCECYLPYRETVEYMLREMDAGRVVEDVLVWQRSAGWWG